VLGNNKIPRASRAPITLFWGAQMLKFRLKALSAAIAAASIGVAAPAWSEEDQIEEIVVTGSYIKRSSPSRLSTRNPSSEAVLRSPLMS
jgi:hypothetical protein